MLLYTHIFLYKIIIIFPILSSEPIHKIIIIFYSFIIVKNPSSVWEKRTFHLVR